MTTSLIEVLNYAAAYLNRRGIDPVIPSPGTCSISDALREVVAAMEADDVVYRWPGATTAALEQEYQQLMHQAEQIRKLLLHTPPKQMEMVERTEQPYSCSRSYVKENSEIATHFSYCKDASETGDVSSQYSIYRASARVKAVCKAWNLGAPLPQQECETERE